MSCWDWLPIDLRVMILILRHEMREDASQTIKKCWGKFQAPKKVAKRLLAGPQLAPWPPVPYVDAMDSGLWLKHKDLGISS